MYEGNTWNAPFPHFLTHLFIGLIRESDAQESSALIVPVREVLLLFGPFPPSCLFNFAGDILLEDVGDTLTFGGSRPHRIVHM